MTVLTKGFKFCAPCLTKRIFRTTINRLKYEGPGKTTMNILNRNFEYGLMVDSVFDNGFILNNGIRALGPMVILPKTVLSWNVSGSENMNEESLSLLLNLDPKLEILVIGLDDNYPPFTPFIKDLKKLLKQYNIASEILPVYHACSTFNFLNADMRSVGAALIPPKTEYLKEQQRLTQGNKNLQDLTIEGDDKLFKARPFLAREMNEEARTFREKAEESLIIKNPKSSERSKMTPGDQRTIFEKPVEPNDDKKKT